MAPRRKTSKVIICGYDGCTHKSTCPSENARHLMQHVPVNLRKDFEYHCAFEGCDHTALQKVNAKGHWRSKHTGPPRILAPLKGEKGVLNREVRIVLGLETRDEDEEQTTPTTAAADDNASAANVKDTPASTDVAPAASTDVEDASAPASTDVEDADDTTATGPPVVNAIPSTTTPPSTTTTSSGRSTPAHCTPAPSEIVTAASTPAATAESESESDSERESEFEAERESEFEAKHGSKSKAKSKSESERKSNSKAVDSDANSNSKTVDSDAKAIDDAKAYTQDVRTECVRSKKRMFDLVSETEPFWMRRKKRTITSGTTDKE